MAPGRPLPVAGPAMGWPWPFEAGRWAAPDVLAPATLVLAGGVLLLRPVLPALRPLRTGVACVFAGLTLALAAGMLGLSSTPVTGAPAWTSAHLQSHGGVLGGAIYGVAHPFVQDLGVDILVVFLLLVGGHPVEPGASIVTAIPGERRSGLIGHNQDGPAASARSPPVPAVDEAQERELPAQSPTSPARPRHTRGADRPRHPRQRRTSRDWMECGGARARRAGGRH